MRLRRTLRSVPRAFRPGHRLRVGIFLRQVIEQDLAVLDHRAPALHLVQFLAPRSRRKPLRLHQPNAMARRARALLLLSAAFRELRIGSQRGNRNRRRDKYLHAGFSTVTPIWSIASYRYPDGFQVAAIGGAFPVES